jgi:hypothetical protein
MPNIMYDHRYKGGNTYKNVQKSVQLFKNEKLLDIQLLKHPHRKVSGCLS